jgi:hypothetical protein
MPAANVSYFVNSYQYSVPQGRVRFWVVVVNDHSHRRGRGYERGSCDNSSSGPQ